MKIIIAGDGKVGLTLTQKLSAEGHDLTLIDSNQKVLDSSVERYDVMGVQGNCASMRRVRECRCTESGSADRRNECGRDQSALLYDGTWVKSKDSYDRKNS